MYTLYLIKSVAREIIFYIPCVFSVKYQIVMPLPAQIFLANLQAFRIPAPSLFFYFFVIVFIFSRPYKKLCICLFKLACTEKKIARRNLVPKCLTYLGDTEWYFRMHGVHYIFKVQVNSLTRLPRQVAWVLLFAAKISQV